MAECTLIYKVWTVTLKVALISSLEGIRGLTELKIIIMYHTEFSIPKIAEKNSSLGALDKISNELDQN